MPLHPDEEKPRLSAGSSSASEAPGDRPESDPPQYGVGTSLPASEVAVEEAFPSWGDPDHGAPPPPPPQGGDSDDGEPEPPGMGKMSFLDHLDELRRRLFNCIIAVLGGFVVCWTYADDIYRALARPLTDVLHELKMDEHLVYTNPVAPFNLYVQLAFVAGLFVASPFILWQVWRFISPGLYKHEKRYAFPFVFFCSGLFISGGLFAYKIAFPTALRFLLTFGSQFRPMITVNEYFSLATTIILGLALVFELPVLILFLSLLGLMTPRFLIRNFRYAVLVIFIAAAAITPTPDIPTMMLFAMPLVGLYLLGTGLSYLVLRLRARSSEPRP